MKNYQNYDRAIFSDAEESLSKIVNKIPNNSVVLDVGCSSGMLGRYLTEKKGCIVDGVDIDASAVDLIRSKYRFTAVKNLEIEPLCDAFKTEAYDYIVVADLIEHLVNPDQLLSELKKLIKPEGTIIFSVPNVTHISNGFELLFGEFNYRENGLLDRTHLRFYSKKSLLDKLQAFGLYAWEVDTVQKEIIETEFSDHISKLFPDSWVESLISQREDALTYQWLVSTRISPDVSHLNVKSKKLGNGIPLLVFSSALHWVEDTSQNFSEDKKIIGQLVNEIEDLTTIDFCFKNEIHVNGLYKLRIDPISDQKPFLICSAEILNVEKNVVWKWQPENIENELFGARLVKFFDSIGTLCQATCDDPQWHPSIDANVLNQITTGWSFRISLKVDDPLLFALNIELIEKLIIAEKAIIDRNRILNSLSWRITKPLRFIEKYILGEK